MVLWLIGLSGSGKSSLSEEILKELHMRHKNAIILDGDKVRALYNEDLGHSSSERLIAAKRILNLAAFLDEQGVDVICSIVCFFPEVRREAKNILSKHIEIYIESKIEDLIERDSKGLYKSFLNGELKDVAGMDLDFPVPEEPDVFIRNSSNLDNFLENAKTICNRFF